MKHLPPPPTRRTDLAEDLHGIRVEDPYRWLEDTQDPETQAWVAAQATYADAYLRALPARATLKEELARLFAIETVGIPQVRRGTYFFMKRKPGQDLPVYYAKDGLDGEPRVVIDPATLSEDGSTVLKSCLPSRDGRLVAYEISRAGNDRNEVRVLDVASGRDLPDALGSDVYPYLACWDAEGTGFWYLRRDPSAPSTQDEEKFHRRAYYHALGTDPAEDPLVFGAGLARESSPRVRLSEDGRYLLGQVVGQTGGEHWVEVSVMDREAEGRGFVVALPGVPGVMSSAAIHRDHLYVQTNADAPRWKLMRAPLASVLAGEPAFADIVPAREDESLEDYALVAGRLFVHTLRDAHSGLREHALDGAPVREVALPVMGSVGAISHEREGSELFFQFSSFAFPPAVYRVDLGSGGVTLVEQMEAGYDTDAIETSQHWFDSKDGTRVPLFLIRRKGLAQDGGNPAVLYGYGGFDVSLTPSFMKASMPFILRGGVYAIANLRGGGEFGKAWHEAGMKRRKQNVFDDFAAAAAWLVEEGHTRPDRLAVSGGSNGGLLTCVTALQHPELVKAVVSSVPVTDMLRYHRFTGGRHWIPDYGDPDDADMISYLLTYSPYHNATARRPHPAILIATASDDDRVHPMHSYKMAARFQETNAGEEPVLLRVELKAGHGGASATSRSVEQLADTWAFLFDELGVDA